MAISRVEGAQFLGCSLVLGEERHCLADEPELFGHDPAMRRRLQTTVGMDTRYTAAPGTTVCDLGELAAFELLNTLDVPRDSIGALIFVTQTPDHTMPGNAHVLHGRLALPTTSFAVDITAGCSGFVYGMHLASMLASHGISDILLLCGDTLSKVVNPRDRTVVPLFGDACSATLVRHVPGAAPMTFVLGSDGSGVPLMLRPAGGQREPSTEATRQEVALEGGLYRSREDLYMDGFGIFNFTMTTQPGLWRAILEASGTTIDALDYVIFHQANRYIVETLRQKLGIAQEKAPADIFSRYGNLNAASIPAVLCDVLGDVLARRSVSAIFQGFGIGLSWGACHIQLDHVQCPPPKFFSTIQVADARRQWGVV